MKLKYFFIIITVVALPASSCNKFLEEKPMNFLNSSNFYQTEEEITAAVYAIYDPQRTFYTGGYAQMNWAIWELPSDQSYPNIGAGVIENSNIDDFNFDPEIIYFNNWWRTSYVTIDRANAVIKNVPNALKVSEEKRNRAIAEARFMRGLAYYELALGWGDVPLIDETNTNFFPQKNARIDVYNFAISDLQFAEQYLPVSWPENDYGRATKYAATAYLAKIYLSLTGYPVKDESKFAAAAQKAKEVIDNGPYGLYENVLENWDPLVPPKEQIYILDKSRTASNGNYFPLYWAPRNQNQLAAQTGADFIGAFLPDPRFYNDFPGDDPRKQKFFMLEATSFMDPSVTVTFPEPVVAKYWGPAYNNGTDQDIVRLRLAEILLIYAEAENEVNGPTAGAYDALNAVRSRAFGDASHNYSGLSKDDFRKAVWRERDLELCFEGVRWTDMIRTQTSRDGSFAQYKNIGNNSPGEKHILFPVPRAELLTNTNIKQNPGY